jgi:ribulose-phosphate 3-epimerase
MNQTLIAPSILASDFSRLGEEVEMLNASEADWIHCDVMDGRFVPNISFGLPVIQAIKRVSSKPLDVHLMIVEPDKYLADFVKAGADILTVHVEACPHLDRTLSAIRELGIKAGVALNPATPVEQVQHVLHLTDLVLLMSVNPGFGGQKFIPYVAGKAEKLRQMAIGQGISLNIEVDGGIQQDTGEIMVKAGANVLVAGSFVFGAPQPSEVIRKLKHIRA